VGSWGIHHLCCLYWSLTDNRRATLSTKQLTSIYFIPTPRAPHIAFLFAYILPTNLSSTWRAAYETKVQTVDVGAAVAADNTVDEVDYCVAEAGMVFAKDYR